MTSMKRMHLLLIVVLGAGVVMSAADPIPVRKAGLWESTMTGVGLGAAEAAAAGPMKQCVDAATDRLAMTGALSAKDCQSTPIVKTAAGYEFEMTCRIAGMTTSSKSVITGDFNSKVSVSVASTMSGGGSLGQESKMTVVSRYVGPCEPGQKPGDIIMPDGKVIRPPGAEARNAGPRLTLASFHEPPDVRHRDVRYRDVPLQNEPLRNDSLRNESPRRAAAAGAAPAAEDVEGYAEFRYASSLIVDGQRVEMASGGRVKGAPSLMEIPLGSEVKVRGHRRDDGVIVAREVEAKPNVYAVYETDMLTASEKIEEQIRTLGMFVQKTPNGVQLVGKLEDSGPRAERVRRITSSLQPPYLPKGVIRAYVLVNKEWNAFAMANGAVFVFSGLLDDMDDDEVAIVLGHELAHATYEHSRRGAKKAMVTQLMAQVASIGTSTIDDGAMRVLVADLLSLSASAYVNGHGRTMEDQADRVGLRYAYEGGWDVRKGPRLWDRFAQKYGEPDAVTSFFFSDHSQSSARARNLERELARNYASGVPKPR